jgi:hypothetical protein
MKFKLLLTLFICCTLDLFGQTIDKTIYDNIYVFLTSETLTKCSGGGVDQTGASSTEDITSGTAFKVTKVLDDGNFVIQILKWPENPKPEKKTVNALLNKNLVSSATDQTTGKIAALDIFFKLPLKTFTTECDLRLNRHSFTLGAVTIPIKMRFGSKWSDGTQKKDFSFSGDISFGLSVGYKYSPSKRYSHNILTGISLTSVPVTPATTQNSITSETNVAALTWHLGYLYQIDNFQIGAFTGIDYLGGKTGRLWNYKDEMWLGIGVGYSIFKSKKTSDTQ